MLGATANPPALYPGVQNLSELTGQWWVAQTRSRFEKALAWDLLRAQIGYFLPMRYKTTLLRGRKRRSLLPLFPSYVFVCGDADDRLEALRTHRVARIIRADDQETLIGELQTIEKAVQRAELLPYPQKPIGRQCRVKTGPFKGVKGTVVDIRGKTHIVLQVNLICQAAAMEIDADFLEFLPDAAPLV